MNNVVVVLGANKDQPLAIMRANEKIKRVFEVNSSSNVYLSESEVLGDSAKYINIALSIQTELSQTHIEKEIKQIEAELNKFKNKWIDIDPILIENNNGDTIFLHSKLFVYCHFLITLNDVLKNKSIQNKYVPDVLAKHPNRHFFEQLEIEL